MTFIAELDKSGYIDRLYKGKRNWRNEDRTERWDISAEQVLSKVEGTQSSGQEIFTTKVTKFGKNIVHSYFSFVIFVPFVVRIRIPIEKFPGANYQPQRQGAIIWRQ